MYIYIYIYIYSNIYIYIYIYIVRPESSVVSVCTVSTMSWVRIPLWPNFYLESKNLSPK